MKAKMLLIAGFIAVTAMTAKAQKFTEGDESLSFLAGETKFNIEYVYDGMMVGKKAEADYKAEKIDAYNKKQPGKGDRWAEKWVNSRSAVYEPMFEELINKMLFKGKTNASAAKNQKDAKYTIVVKTVMLEPGFNSFAMKVNPYCDFEVSFVETATGKVMAKAFLNNVQGVVVNDNDWDFDPSNRIKECFAKAGKMVGGKMAKALKPKK
ncbi:MAG: hypothetical protein J0L87_11640 [Bacteroidetes bacterium]|nr:hypothetical protein [Bacteroidota bacterium]